MFDQLRASVRHLLDSASSPAESRSALVQMKEALVHARLGVDDLRRGVRDVERRLVATRAELETTRRRRELAAGIGDAETVAVAARFERTQADRVAVLEAKHAAAARELTLAEREATEMAAELRRALATGSPDGATRSSDVAAAAAELDAELGLGTAGRDATLRTELDALGASQARAAREAEAEDRLAALKRRMGK